MMEEPIEEAYFMWLCAKVIDPHVQNYWGLLRILHTTEFVWLLPGDQNRGEDGIELREQFLRGVQEEADEYWLSLPCSLLELFIAFSYRAEFATDIAARNWFWVFMRNLDLSEYRRIQKEDEETIDDILYNFIWRTYEPNGQGGMFPLREPEEDQTGLEIWYQFCSYLIDQDI